MKSKVAYWGVFAALAILFGYVESLIPLPVGIPGIKLGVANVVAVVVLYKRNVKEAVCISLTRVLVSGFLFSSGMMLIYSLSGALLSVFCMAWMKHTSKFSIYGVSMAGGVAHNLGQLIVAAIVTESISICYYVPVLLVAGCMSGLFVGYLSAEILCRLKN